MDSEVRPTILVGVSGSPASAKALVWAAEEAQRGQAKLRVVCSWQPEQLAYYTPAPTRHTADQHMQEARRQLQATVRTVFGTALPAGLITEVVEGMPERILVDRSADADLLVLGSTSAPSYAGRSIGPVIRTCLSHAHCPVVVIGPEGAHEPGGRISVRKAASAAGRHSRARRPLAVHGGLALVPEPRPGH